MDLSLLHTQVSEHDQQRTGARFTVRSANSPSYSLTRRPGVRKTKGISEEERESTEEVGGRDRYGTDTKMDEDHTVTGYQARTGSRSCVKGQSEEEDVLTKLNQNGTTDRTITEVNIDRSGNPASESRGRTESRRYTLNNRSKSLDWRGGRRSPDRGKTADTLLAKRGGDTSKQAGGLDERQTGAEGIRSRVMFSVQAYNSAGASNDGPERSPVSQMSQTLDRTSRGRSLPSRFRTLSGSGSDIPAASYGPKGGQSIMERIEKLFGSAGFGKTEDFSSSREFSNPVTSYHKEKNTDFLISRSCERAAGGTFPRRFSSGEKSTLSPVQSRKSFTWKPKDTLGSEISLSSGTSRTRETQSGGQWQGQNLGRFSQEGLHCGRELEDIGTRSLDRTRSRFSVAPQIRAARAAGGITECPQKNTFSEEERSVSWRDSSGLTERRASGSTDQGRVNHGEEKGETGGVSGAVRERTGWLKEPRDGTREKTQLKSISTDEDVFESTPQEIRTQTTERNKDVLSVHSAASVRNKINQFEALTQRATGQVLMPRRAYSVPTQLSRAHDGVRKSGSAKAIGGLRDKWEGLKEGGEADDKTEQKVAGAGKMLASERSLSVDEVGLRLGRKEREGNDLVVNEVKETDGGNNRAEDFDKYSRLKNTLEIPLNGEAERRCINFVIDETDFSKVSSPEGGSEQASFSIMSNTGDTGAQEMAPLRVSSPVSDEDRTPTNTPNHSPFLSPTAPPENFSPIADRENESTSVLTPAAKTPEPDSPDLSRPLASSSLPLISPDVSATYPGGKKRVLDLDAWVAGLNANIKVWNDNDDDYDDDDESTQKDDDSNYDSDSGESSVTITSNMSQSDRRSFSVSLSDLCNFAGVECESENDSDEWQSTSRRSASLSSDMSAFSCVSVLPNEELEKLLEDVRSLGDSTLQDYDDVQVVVLHKEIGVGLGFSVAGGVDQNKPITVHRVFHSGVAAQEGSIREGDQVLSINGTALCGYAHWEALRVLRRAKTRDLGVVVLRRGEMSTDCKGGAQRDKEGQTQTQFTETGQRVCVCLEKNSRDLGFSLEGGVGSSLENRPLTVQKIFQGGPVDKVCPGDEVVEINGVSMVGLRRLEAWTLIRKLPPGPVDVVLRRPLKHLET